ncbi:MAG: hypothetical protein U1B80_08840 [Anaerolineaceae bacterium]|nr:hypothetical protein [Anaerolineaceae bacterium]
MSESKPFSLVKPTLQTPLHIDFEWWKQHEGNWRVFLLSYLCADHQTAFEAMDTDAFVDWVDPVTAEVRFVDGLQHALITHCARQPGFITTNTTLVDAAFRIFLANGNSPLTAEELAEKIGKPAQTILRTLSGVTVYKGLRPVQQTFH